MSSNPDSTTMRVRAIVLDETRRAYGLPDAPVPLAHEYCTCGHHYGAHHGPNGEGRCDDCSCPAFEDRVV